MSGSPLDNGIEFIEAAMTRVLPLIDASRRRDLFIAAAITGAMASEREEFNYGHVSNIARRAIAVADAVLEELGQAGRAPA